MATAESSEVKNSIADDEEKDSPLSAIMLAAVVLVVALLSVEFGLQTMIWIETKSWAGANPWILEVPKALPPTQASAILPPTAAPQAKKGKAAAQPAGPPQIKLYNYEFTAPWPANSEIKPGPTYSQVRFASGQVIVFFDPASEIDTIREMKTQNAAEYQRLANVFGDQTPDSDYALYQAAYDASPAQGSPFISRASAVRLNGALLYKLGFGYDALPGIESFELGKNHGFEFGDAASGRPVAARVFNDRDDQFRFIFTIAVGSGAKITQDDMNLVMQSLQPVPLLER